MRKLSIYFFMANLVIGPALVLYILWNLAAHFGLLVGAFVYLPLVWIGAGRFEKEVKNKTLLKKDTNLKTLNTANDTASDSRSAPEEIPLIQKAIDLVVEHDFASVSLLQRKLRLNYQTSAQLIDEMEAMGVISEYAGSEPRKILITHEEK